MSFQITTAFVEQYKNNIDILSQQMGSKLRGAVDVETVTGDKAFFEQIGSVDAEQKTSRHADSPYTEVPHSRRSVTVADFHCGDYVDKLDKFKMLIDPTSEYAQAFAYALGRQIDDFIIEASIGTAYTGHTGATATALPSGQKVAVNLSGSNEGLTINKLIAAKSLFGQNDVDVENPRNKLYFAWSQVQQDDLLKTTQVTSADYNSVKALVQGSINSFMGFEFKRTERLELSSSTDIRECFAWARSGIKLALNADIQTEMEKRADKSFAMYVYTCMSGGATRMEEDKVVQVSCDESP